MKKYLVVSIAACGLAYLITTLTIVAYIKFGGRAMQKFCTTDWLGQPVSEMQKVVPQTRFLLESYEAQVQIRSVASASGHRCHVWFDERGVISALEVVFHF